MRVQLHQELRPQGPGIVVVNVPLKKWRFCVQILPFGTHVVQLWWVAFSILQPLHAVDLLCKLSPYPQLLHTYPPPPL